MNYYSQEVKSKVRNSIDIVDLVSEYIQLDKKGKNYFGLCPFHQDSNPSMSVSPEKQIYTCFSCGASGDVFTFYKDYHGLSFNEAIYKLANKYGVDIPKNESFNFSKNTISKTASKIYEINELVTKLYHHILINTDDGSEALEYLGKRGFDLELIKKYKIGFVSRTNSNIFDFLVAKGYSEEEILASGIGLKNEYGFSDRFRYRIMFPLLTETNRVAGFSGRVINNGDPKYLNIPETEVFRKSELLFNLNNAKPNIRKQNNVILMEGFMDVIKSSKFGIDNAVATMGTAFTSDQARILRRITDKIYICFDGDEAGQKATQSTIKILEKYKFKIYVVTLSNGLDPDDYLSQYGKEAFLLELNKSILAFDFKLKILQRKVDRNDSDSISDFLKSSFKLVRSLNDDIKEKVYLEKLSKLVDIPFNIINQSYSVNKEDTEVIPKIEVPINEQKNDFFTVYQKAEQIVLAAMIKDRKVAEIFEKKIGAFSTEKYNILANYIVIYYKKYDTIDISDFISHLEDKNEIINTFIWITENIEDRLVNDGSIHECINKIISHSTIIEIEKLKTKIASTVNSTQKAVFAKKKSELERKLKEY